MNFIDFILYYTKILLLFTFSKSFIIFPNILEYNNRLINILLYLLFSNFIVIVFPQNKNNVIISLFKSIFLGKINKISK